MASREPRAEGGEPGDARAPRRILVVEDDEKIRASLLFQLRAEGFTPEAVATAEEAWTRLGDPGGTLPDLLLLDVRLRGMSGVELARSLAAAGRLPATIVISGEASITETVEALRLGVHDFVEKPFSRERLLQSIRNALEHAALRRRVATLESRISEPEILGDSPAVRRLRDAIAKVAPTGGRVLILGESGSGKELVASAIHRASPRREAPFVKINCAALPAHLVEDELFGHARGAFTDAKAAKPGLFEEAHRGTLFLDEIGDMELPLQARLLRVLEDGRTRRIGETRERQVDVRVLAATNRALEQAVAAGQFRQDLYFRLAHLPIEVPPLRERVADIGLLARHFIERFALQHRLRRLEIDAGVFPPLERYAWPGNVRELRNVCERLVVFGADPLTADQLPTALFQAAPTTGGATGATGLLRPAETWPPLALRDFKLASEREYVESVLQRTNWNVTAAAKLLDIQRTYLHERVSALGLERPTRGGDGGGGPVTPAEDE